MTTAPDTSGDHPTRDTIDTPRTSLLSMRARSQPDHDVPAPRSVDLRLHGLPGGDSGRAVEGDHGPATVDGIIADAAVRPHGPPGERDDNFSVVTDDNGTAHVVRKPDTTIHSAIPTPKQIADGVDAWTKVDKFTDQDYVTLSGNKIFEGNGVHVIPFEGSVDFLIPVVGGNFDIAQAIQRGLGEDPYRAHRQHLLDASRDERAAALARKRTLALADTRRMMTRNLERMWASTVDPAARKRAAFEMWDECAETGDAETVAAGAEARAAIVDFLAARGVAYSAGELADLNAHRHSRAGFEPRLP